MAVTTNQPVNISVFSIREADNEGFFKLDVKFDNSTKIYPYIRKSGIDGNGNKIIIISGCRITFRKALNDNFSYEVLSITREYDVKGYKRRSTIKQAKPRSKSEEEDKLQNWLKSDVEKESDWQQSNLEEYEENKSSSDEAFPVLEDDEQKEEDKPEEPRLPKKVRHEKYPMIKACLEANIPIYLAGPAGSGKNFTVEQIARENGWNFYYTNSVQQEYKLTGFIDAGGTYQETEFYKACTDSEECIFFLDEMDASVPEALVLINAAIANGYFEFPNGRVNLGDVHFVAAGNTVGSGADELYTGRMVLDQATLDRFAIIEFDYSRPIELKLTNGNECLVDFVRDLREKAESNGIRATFSYRCLIMVTKLEQTDLELNDILTISVLKGMDKDTINTLRIYGSSKYHRALEKIQNRY